MRCSDKTETFSHVIQIASNYFGLPADIVFIADKPNNGCIFLNEQKVFEAIFPFQSAKKVGFMPELHIVLKRRMTSIDIVDNEKSLKQQKRQEVEEAEKSEEAKNKIEQERAEEEQKRAEQNQLIEQYRRRRWLKRFVSGMLQFIVALVLFAALFLSAWDYFNNSDSVKMKEAMLD